MNATAVQPHPIADSYWVQPGLLLAGEYRAHAEARRAQGRRAARRRRAPVYRLDRAGRIQPAALLAVGAAAGCWTRHLEVAHRPAWRSLTWVRLSDAPTWSSFGCDRRGRGGSARPVYVHCFGGIGRTGTVGRAVTWYAMAPTLNGIGRDRRSSQPVPLTAIAHRRNRRTAQVCTIVARTRRVRRGAPAPENPGTDPRARRDHRSDPDGHGADGRSG